MLDIYCYSQICAFGILTWSQCQGWVEVGRDLGQEHWFDCAGNQPFQNVRRNTKTPGHKPRNIGVCLQVISFLTHVTGAIRGYI